MKRPSLPVLIGVAGIAVAALGFAFMTLRPADGASGGTAGGLPMPDLTDAEPRVAAALSTLRDGVLATPASATAWGRLGMSLDVHGYKPEARDAYRRATTLAPGEFRWSYYLAVGLDDAGDPEALEWFDRARDLLSDYPPLLIRHGQALYNAGQLDAADSALVTLLRADSSLSAPYRLLGRVSVARGDVEGGRDWLLRGLRVQPRDGQTHGILAGVYRQLGEPGEAELARQRALLYPSAGQIPDPLGAELTQQAVSSRWFIIRGEAYLNQGHPEAALRELDSALAVRPSEAYLLNIRGRALQALSRIDEAAQSMQTALKIRPQFLEARLGLSAIRFRQGRVAEAEAHADTARQSSPTEAQPYLNLGLFAQATGRRATAITRYLEGLQNAEFDTRLAARLAWLLATSPEAANRNGEEAVRLAEAICEIDQYSVPATLDLLAAAYAEAGRFDEAAERAAEAAHLARLADDQKLASGIESRLALYEARRPYREGG